MKTTVTALGLVAALGTGIPAIAMANDYDSQASAKTSIEAVADMHPDKLQGKTVQTQDGQTIGEIQKVVIDDNSQQMAAVIEADDFLNSSDADAAIPLGNLQLEGDNVVLMSQDAKMDLRNNKYDPAKYSDATESDAEYNKDNPRQSGNSDIGANPGSVE